MPDIRTLAQAPGPRGHWFWGSFDQRREDPLGLFLRAHEEHGEFVRLRMGPAIHLVSVSSPALVKQVLVDRADCYGKPPSLFRGALPLLGNGLFMSGGDFWKRQRRLMQPAFHKERLAALAGAMVDATREMLARWRSRPSPHEPLDMAAEMMRLTLVIVGRTLFSADVGGATDRLGPAITQVLEETNHRILSLLPLYEFIPGERGRRFRQSLAVLDAAVYEVIASRRAGQTQGEDLLAMLMAMQDADTGERMTDTQLRDEVMTLLLAGHETTANLLAWMWHMLSQHPEVEARAHAEVHAVLGEREPTAQDVPRLVYLTQVLEETLRLYPPVWILARQPVKEDVLGGVQLPPSARVIVATAPWVLHQNPALWPDPTRFDPERFAPGLAASRPRFAFMPFGGGQRLCIGQGFAMMEATLVAAEVLRHFRPRAVPGHRVDMEPLVTLRPRGGLPLVLEPRRVDRPTDA